MLEALNRRLVQPSAQHDKGRAIKDHQIGATAGGVALFAFGVMLYSFSFRIYREVATVFVIKNLVQPGIAAELVFAFGRHGALAEGLVIVLACPAATACPMLASTYCVGEESAADVGRALLWPAPTAAAVCANGLSAALCETSC